MLVPQCPDSCIYEKKGGNARDLVVSTYSPRRESPKKFGGIHHMYPVCGDLEYYNFFLSKPSWEDCSFLKSRPPSICIGVSRRSSYRTEVVIRISTSVSWLPSTDYHNMGPFSLLAFAIILWLVVRKWISGRQLRNIDGPSSRSVIHGTYFPNDILNAFTNLCNRCFRWNVWNRCDAVSSAFVKEMWGFHSEMFDEAYSQKYRWENSYAHGLPWGKNHALLVLVFG